MEDYTHPVDTTWKDADGFALERRVKAVNDWLDHTENLVKMFEKDQTVAAELRSVAGILRSRRNDMVDAEAKIKAELKS